MKSLLHNTVTRKNINKYCQFDQLNGNHPLKEFVPEAYVEYQARQKKSGKVYYFNFALAKQLGLISEDHPEKMNAEIEKKILETFNIVIINEYDNIHNIKHPPETIKENTYMATRYLQLQHPSKQGKTSGDGRSVWNGQVTHHGVTWDISSCGTGATRLSPASAKMHKFFKTGDPSISYGCGCSEKDEGVSSSLFSEVMYLNGIRTERVLAIIEHKNGLAINVRAHPNLIRPSHFFAPLKQNNYEYLKKMYDYYVTRQRENGFWSDYPKDEIEGYEYFLRKIANVFATMVAQFEDEYIFCWLDWDGDNILMDGSIIDYGSVRQFGLFHHEYRYDDVERYSTSITEQKIKAKYLIQTFVQMTDFLKNQTKRPIKIFEHHHVLKEFEKIFEYQKDKNLLYKIGFNNSQVSLLLNKHRKIVRDFRQSFSYFERIKSIKGIKKVADGINWSAIFCMRDILREYPQIMQFRNGFLTSDEFIEIIKSSYATKKDLVLNSYRKQMIHVFQEKYMQMVDMVAAEVNKSGKNILCEVTMRSSVINKYDRITGDAVTIIVDKILSLKQGPDEIYKIMHDFLYFQNHDPSKIKQLERHKIKNTKGVKNLLEIVRSYREGI